MPDDLPIPEDEQPRRGRPLGSSNRTNEVKKWKTAFLAVFRNCGNIRIACEKVGVSRKHVWMTVRKDPDGFGRRFREAKQDAKDLAEREIWRRGFEGVNEPVIHDGEICGTWVDAEGHPVAEGTPGAYLIPLTVKKYDSKLALAWAQANIKKYQKRTVTRTVEGRVDHRHAHAHVHTGMVKTEVEFTPDLSEIPIELRRQWLEEIRKQRLAHEARMRGEPLSIGFKELPKSESNNNTENNSEG
ncbi:MAG: hypothetical protein KGL39_00740 [Patescibacteria group bacterium]|nr:hypothetical protein [Patescibacteria group bacterium]